MTASLPAGLAGDEGILNIPFASYTNVILAIGLVAILATLIVPLPTILLDMGVPISVVLGQTQIPIRRLLQLGPGSVVELDKSIEAPADLYLKDSKFAEADVVVVEDRFAVRIQKILGAGTPADP